MQHTPNVRVSSPSPPPPPPQNQAELLVAGDNFIIKLAFDFYGNFTLQDLIEAAGRLRLAAASLRASKQLSNAQADSAAGIIKGQDFLSRPCTRHPPAEYSNSTECDLKDPGL